MNSLALAIAQLCMLHPSAGNILNATTYIDATQSAQEKCQKQLAQCLLDKIDKKKFINEEGLLRCLAKGYN
jgi:hypothetical protein